MAAFEGVQDPAVLRPPGFSSRQVEINTRVAPYHGLLVFIPPAPFAFSHGSMIPDGAILHLGYSRSSSARNPGGQPEMPPFQILVCPESGRAIWDPPISDPRLLGIRAGDLRCAHFGTSTIRLS